MTSAVPGIRQKASITFELIIEVDYEKTVPGPICASGEIFKKKSFV